MKLVAALALMVALVATAASTAAAQTPAGYRAQVNALCRSYTPRLKADSRAMANAAKRKDAQAYYYALGHTIGLALAEDAQIERTPVPAALRGRMAPILRLLRTADAHARSALRKAADGDARGFVAEVDKLSRMAPGLNRRLDAAGLRDCGSNQS